MAQTRQPPGPGGPGRAGPGGPGPAPGPAFPAVAGGYHGKILRVNLSSKSVSTEPVSYEICRRYIGGAGFVAYFLWTELKQGVDALSPDNKLIFALGPVTGLSLPGAARNCVGAKSPLTGGIARAEVGGFWGAELKRAGYDAIIIEGKAEKPVYLWIKDGQASIKDAGHLWGKETKETEAAIRTELDDEKIQVALIGLAGENMVRFACIMNGLHDAAGRGGLGAVMGSKNLKAVAVRGRRLPKIADSELIKEIRKVLSQPHRLSSMGTGSGEVEMFEKTGNLPIRNFRDGVFPEASQIHAGVMKETMWVGMEGCYACPIRCKKVVKFEEPYPVDSAYGGPEYETIAALGSNCGVGNVKAICKGNERCGAYSLDTISTGGVIAFAMECFEKGLLTEKDTGGIELRFGNDEAMLKVIDLIARREGIGDLLAEGTARMAKKIGRGSEDFAMNVKGLEAGLHEPRLSPAFALGYMVGPTGADHSNSIGVNRLSSNMGVGQLRPLGILTAPPPNDMGPQKVKILILAQLKEILEDSMVVCSFPPFTYQIHTDIMTAATGWDTGLGELVTAAERTMTVSRLFNIREGLSAADDILPERYYQPKTDGALSNSPLDRAVMDKARKAYYALMGWDTTTGIPLPEKVESLAIE